MDEPSIRTSSFADLSVNQLYALLRLRVDVFVVEQACPYPELDGRDIEPGTEHLWVEADGVVISTVRILRDAEVRHIGRVATARGFRGRGYAAALVHAAIERVGTHPIEVGAQAHLQGWYEHFGFVRNGPDYIEDGIDHLPMHKEGWHPTGE